MLKGSDPDSPALPLTFSIITQPVNGTVSGTPPNITYTSNAGFYGNDQIVFKTNNGYLDSAAATLALTVYAKPEAFSQSLSTKLGTPLTIPLSGNDPDLPPLPLVATVTVQPAHGTLAGTPPSVTYTPTPGFFGVDSVKFKVNNGYLDSNEATIAITIIGAPIPTSQQLSGERDTLLSVTLLATDPNSPPLALTFGVATQPAHGVISGTAPNLIYKPNDGYIGADSFTFSASNGSLSKTGTIDLAIYGIPSAISQNIELNVNTTASIMLSGIDLNIPALPLSYVVTSAPAHGSLSGTPPALAYTPNAGYFGTDSFTFSSTNGFVDSVDGTNCPTA